MKKTPSLHAIDPHRSASVSASAGTGKTWLLVSRIIRLLLTGAKPDAILAITFTRKAAAEMQTRLAKRLCEFAAADDKQIKILLQQIEAPINHTTVATARQLYEHLLHAPRQVRTTTFHAFCQEILRRFPLEADIAPGFELIESPAELIRAAWDALVREATLAPDGALAQQLESLMEQCHGLFNTQTAVFSFLDHRSDWWAYTQFQADPVDFAIMELEKQLQINSDSNPLRDLARASMQDLLTEFATLLTKHAIAKHLKAAHQIENALTQFSENSLKQGFDCLRAAFLTKEDKPLARKASKTQEKAMGATGQQRFLELHERICEHLLVVKQHLARRNLVQTCSAWYRVGQQLLDKFQLLKTEQRLLDFSDLEWKAYRLLNHGDNAHWIQYKLDQRIDHLLIDEFQDTNPTQWQLITPLLEELAAGNDERQRSVFFVGDHKQSIYRFRRAAPELFDTAQQWLSQHLDAVRQPLSTSWRSAPVIMQAVNAVFSQGPLQQRIHEFAQHQTHHKDLWGQVQVLPLVAAERAHNKEDKQTPELRNALLSPREIHEDQRYYQEGELLAQQIKTLIDNDTIVLADNKMRSLQYGDIMILLRHRTHSHWYERALREASIPYNSANRGTLLESLESQDMMALLETLVTPYNNLSLAIVLRSPMFSCSNEQLMQLAQIKNGTWMQRLGSFAQSQGESSNAETELERAWRLLSQWHALAGSVPVHDLLDRIYNEGDIVNRYRAAYPEHLRHRVHANLTRFIELALEIDSGRYPSIGHFLTRLTLLRSQDQDGPDEGKAQQTQSRVQIMTIHAAKGMEAPVVFLVDATNTRSVAKTYQSVVDWPASSPQPQKLVLSPKKKHLDDITAALLQKQYQAEQTEEANLLYVALTRAKQMLFVTGCKPTKGDNLGWYGDIRGQLKQFTQQPDLADDEAIVVSSGTIAPRQMPLIQPQTPPKPSFDVKLNGPFSISATLKEIAPSYTVRASSDLTSEIPSAMESPYQDLINEDQKTRGIVIHRILYLYCHDQKQDAIIRSVKNQYNIDLTQSPYQQWLDEAEHSYRHELTKFIFNSNYYTQSFDEAPLVYQQGQRTVHGFIDRLLISDDKIIIIDYKTHQVQSDAEQDKLCAFYQPQLALYQRGITKAWPNKPVESYLLFTHKVNVKRVN